MADSSRPIAEDNSVTFWIQAVRRNDELAANELWKRYFDRLMQYARSRMATLPRATYDEEDAAISTFRILYTELQAGSYPELAGRDELWHLMLTVLLRKIGHRVVYEAAEKRTLADGLGARIDEAVVADPVSIQIAGECSSLLAKLRDPNLEQVAIWKLEGFTNQEIADKLKRTRRTVQRMLDLIRELWLEELNV